MSGSITLLRVSSTAVRASLAAPTTRFTSSARSRFIEDSCCPEEPNTRY